MNYDVIEVRTPEHLRLKVTFRDGLSGEIKFLESHLKGVFEPLKDPKVFMQVKCENGFVEWPGDVDLAPDFQALLDSSKMKSFIAHCIPSGIVRSNIPTPVPLFPAR